MGFQNSQTNLPTTMPELQRLPPRPVPDQRQLAGRPIDTADAQIAAIALATGLTLVTRNTKDFASIEDLTVVNPWQDH